MATSGLSFKLFFLSMMGCVPLMLSYQSFQQRQLPLGVMGPESFTFDCDGEGPYTGVADGRIFKWEGYRSSWREFATTSPRRVSDRCDCLNDPDLEPICGRPLGVKFDNVQCELYVADAYFGLMRVPRNGGLAVAVVTAAEGVPFRFTNSLDIDQENSIVYFTDSSMRFQRRDHFNLSQSDDNTARFMKFDIKTGEVTVLLRGLYFANGVALSIDKTYVLIAETSKFHIRRYWLQGPKANTSEVFARLPGTPDNIIRNSRGDFWVALNNGRTGPLFWGEIIGVRLDGEGKVLQTLQGDGFMGSTSEVNENRGTLFVGSIAMSYVAIQNISYFNTDFRAAAKI